MLIRNIRMYIRLCLLVWGGISFHKKQHYRTIKTFFLLANRKCPCYRNLPYESQLSESHKDGNRSRSYFNKFRYSYSSSLYFPNPLIFYFVNVCISIAISKAMNIPYTLGKTLSTSGFIGNMEIDWLVQFLEYALGSIVFAMLICRIAIVLFKKKILFRQAFHMTCFASAWFLPMVFLHSFYNDSIVPLCLSAVDFYNLRYSLPQLINCVDIIAILVWGLMKWFWIEYISGALCNNISLKSIGSFYAETANEKASRYMCVLLCFMLVSYTMPLLSYANEYISKQHIANILGKYNSALEARNDKEMKRCAFLLSNSKRVPVKARYYFLLAFGVCCEHEKGQSDNIICNEAFDALCDGNYEKMNTIIFQTDCANESIGNLLPVSDIRKLFKNFEEGNEGYKDTLMLSKNRFQIMYNFALTPYDDSMVLDCLEIKILADIAAEISEIVLENNCSMVRPYVNFATEEPESNDKSMNEKKRGFGTYFQNNREE